jgi:hypothetical protein
MTVDQSAEESLKNKNKLLVKPKSNERTLGWGKIKREKGP